MSKPLSPQKWRMRIQRSLEFQKDRKLEAARLKRGYKGDYSVEGRQKLDGNKDEIAVNFIFSFIETVRPTLIPGTPKVFVKSQNHTSDASEESFQAVINHFIRKLGAKKKVRACVDDWFYGHCGMLTDWEYIERPKFDEQGKPVYLNDPLTGEPQLDEDGEPECDYEIVRDQPLLRRIDPWDIVLDCESKSRDEDMWRGWRDIMTISEFRKLPGVTPEMKKKIRGRSLPPDLVRQPNGDSRASSEKNWVIVWRIYDLENEMTYLLPDGEAIDFFAEEKEWPWEMEVGGDRYPLTILEAKLDSENPYSFSSFIAYWGQIQERNKLRTIIQSNVRRFAPGWVAKKGMMDEEQKQKFVNSKIAEYVETNQDPKGIITKPMPVLGKEFFDHGQIVEADLNATSSLAEFRGDEQGNDTATEASLRDAKANIRKGEAKSDLQDFLAVVFGKMGQLCQQHLTLAVAVKIKAPEGPEEFQWLEADSGHIQGDFDLDVQPGVDEKESEGLFRQQTLKTLEVMSKNPWANQKKMAVMAAKALGKQPEDILKTQQEYDQEQAAMQAAQQAEIDAKAKPPISFAPIKLETLTPEIQALVIFAAMKQNGVDMSGAPIPGKGGVPGVSPADSPPSTSMSNPPNSSVTPGNDLNQAPPAMQGANIPPATPVMPASNLQGGHT